MANMGVYHPILSDVEYNKDNNGGNGGGNNMQYVSQKEFLELQSKNEISHVKMESKLDSMDFKINWLLGLITTVVIVPVILWAFGHFILGN